MSIIEKIRAEIERLKEENNNIRCDSNKAYCQGYGDAFVDLLPFLDTLESEKPMNPNEDVFKIWGTTEKEYLAKSMDKVHLEMEIATYLKDWEDDEEIGLHLSTDNGCIPIELEDVRDLARHFAEWGYLRAAEKYDEIEYNRQRAEEEIPNDLEEAAEKQIDEALFKWSYDDEDGIEQYVHDAFIAGAKWQADHAPLPEDTVLFNKGVAEGKRLAEEEQADLLTIAHLQGADQMKEQMMKEAVEGYVNYYEDSGGILMAEAQVGCPYHSGDKVRIIIIKDDGKSN